MQYVNRDSIISLVSLKSISPKGFIIIPSILSLKRTILNRLPAVIVQVFAAGPRCASSNLVKATIYSFFSASLFFSCIVIG